MIGGVGGVGGVVGGVGGGFGGVSHHAHHAHHGIGVGESFFYMDICCIGSLIIDVAYTENLFYDLC